jgi:two-component system NarL family sensor kinase
MFIYFTFLLLIFILMIVSFYIFQKKIVGHELKFQKKYLESIILAQEQDRERTAQDLHYRISSKHNLVSLKSTQKTTSQKLEIIDNIIKSNNEAIASTRRIIHNLLPPVLEKFGLNQVIIELIFDIENTKRVSIYRHNNIEFTTVGFNIQLYVFRIIQELINNSLMHGKATGIKIEFVLQNNK